MKRLAWRIIQHYVPIGFKLDYALAKLGASIEQEIEK